MSKGAFQKGQQVRLKSRPAEGGEVLSIVTVGGSSELWYKVRFANGIRSVSESSLMVLGIPETPEEQLAAGIVGGSGELRLLFTLIRLNQQKNLTDQLRSLRAARLTHLPYQYKPLLKYLESDRQRILIADEVGLGKTIEAGIIISELQARQELQRVLIIVPSNLMLKWQNELRERFGFEFEIRDNRWVRDVLLRPLRDGEDPPTFNAICALEGMRLLAGQFESVKPTIDLVIFDEAHRLRRDSSLSHRLGRALGESSEGVILCSATPMQTASTDLYNLIRILLGEEAGSFRDFERDLEINRPIVLAANALAKHDPVQNAARHLASARDSLKYYRPADLPLLDECIRQANNLKQEDMEGRINLLALISRLNPLSSLLTRTRRRAVFTRAAPRIAKTRPICFSQEEIKFYETVTEDTRRRTAGGRWTGEVFSAIMRQRKAASCLSALAEEMEQKIVDDEAGSALAAELLGDNEPDGTVPTLPSVLKQPLTTDSKLRELLDLIKELNKANLGSKLIIFTTFRGTVRYLDAKLREAGWGVETLTGEITDRKERMRRVDRVKNAPDCHILLVTEVGSEGIDLQFSSTLVNYDLPWNPMTVEQRIGRLDRIGQMGESIRIFNLAVENTIEKRILDRLYERLMIFEHSIGALEVILGERIQKLSLELAQLTPAEQNKRLDDEALAIGTMQADAERLDAEAIKLLGDDAYYNHRLTQIEAAQGDISEDLRVFVQDFLHREFKSATLVRDQGTPEGLFRLTFDSNLLQFMTQIRETGRQSYRAFLDSYAENRNMGVPITFKQDIAEQDRRVEFLTSTHWFVRAIAAHVDAQNRTLVRFFALGCTSVELPVGDYFLGVALQRISGIRPRHEVVIVAASLAKRLLLEDAVSDKLWADVLRSGEQVHGVALDPAKLATGQELVDSGLIARMNRRADILREENDLFVNRRIDSLRRWYGSRIDSARRVATSHSDERVKRMNAGRIVKLSASLETEVRRAEESKIVESESRVEAYVWARITTKQR